ncbi:recombinase zinc beta ribbon domain-containing protein [Propionimicrobium lymphophilum]|uniref:recombinase zinc beta ribbon domain-containing protein n=1 Tax=Propionimicrobium lymphophilum TaxID=33012 RepID=UPI0003FAE488|nr:zinc ribbon domain-containing protein [Propionimicrobium lymphophilum]
MTGNHEPIIDLAVWEQVQAELARRAGKGEANTHPFAGKIICADCGGVFCRKIWHSTSKYRRYIWRCNNKYKPGYHCTTPHVTEQQIKEAFVHALTERVNDHAVLDDAMQLLDDTVYNTTELENRQTEIATRMEETVALMNQLVTENATSAHDPDEYDARWQQLEQRYQQQEHEHQGISDQIADLTTRRVQAVAIHDYLATRPPLEYSAEAWNVLVRYLKVSESLTCCVEWKV